MAATSRPKSLKQVGGETGVCSSRSDLGSNHLKQVFLLTNETFSRSTCLALGSRYMIFISSLMCA